MHEIEKCFIMSHTRRGEGNTSLPPPLYTPLSAPPKLYSHATTEKVYSGVEIVPARRLKLSGQGVHICTMPLYTKTTSHSGNNIGIMLGIF